MRLPGFSDTCPRTSDGRGQCDNGHPQIDRCIRLLSGLGPSFLGLGRRPDSKHQTEQWKSPDRGNCSTPPMPHCSESSLRPRSRPWMPLLVRKDRLKASDVAFEPEADVRLALRYCRAANDGLEPEAVVRKLDEHGQEYSSSINRRAPGNRRIVFDQTLQGS